MEFTGTDTECRQLAEAVRRGEELLSQPQPPSFNEILAQKKTPEALKARLDRSARREREREVIRNQARKLYSELGTAIPEWRVGVHKLIKELTDNNERERVRAVSSRFSEADWEVRQLWKYLKAQYQQGSGGGKAFNKEDVKNLRTVKKIIGKKLYAGG